MDINGLNNKLIKDQTKELSISDFIHESLRQNLFWLQIMSEHAFFIRLGLPCEEVALRLEAERLQQEFARLLEEARKIAKSPTRQDVFRLNREAINLTTAIIDFKSRVLKLIICCNIVTGFNFPLLIDHIRREAIFFRAALVRLQEDLTVGPVEELIQSGSWRQAPFSRYPWSISLKESKTRTAFPERMMESAEISGGNWLSIKFLMLPS